MTLPGDVRFAFRQLRRTPVFTAIVLATLGLCIGVNTAVYSVLDAVLLRPAPYPDADRLGMMATLSRSKGQEFLNHSQNGMMFEAVRDRVASLEIAAFVGTAAILLAVAAGAAVAPALRILRMDPARTLRDE